MQFNDTTNKNGIIQDCERYCGITATGISGNSVLLGDFTAYSNSTLRSLWHLSFLSCGNWQYEDNNQTDLPQATANLTSAQTTYALPSSALTVNRIEVKDAAGNWTKLTPIAESHIYGAVDEFMKTDAQPMYYRLVGNTFEIFPASNYNSTSGLKVYFDRGSVAFAASDTTKTPGIAGEYHDLIPLGASLKYLKIKRPGSAETAQVDKDYQTLELKYKQYLSGRFKDKRPRVGRVYSNYR